MFFAGPANEFKLQTRNVKNCFQAVLWTFKMKTYAGVLSERNLYFLTQVPPSYSNLVCLRGFLPEIAGWPVTKENM